ncbi:RNA polymerase sigma-70 factor [Aestuariibaculum sp. M13]|uniref:RNA polymerase sigma-70 factor n=1 Tax=Aestuariibaculum sp. M13 TaxID=2967132 RepID=UPI00215A0906|nr:RNA polymerase sigma-70 factor [Aestuariibaculum sp. M13]MCR8668031.1 RNA polymerase sigma-70 factor [Aestuariibaculum sp. M13]
MKNIPINSELLNDLKKDSKEAFREIYMLFYEDLCVFTFAYTKDHELSEDLVQSAFLKLWEQRKSLEIKDNIKGYLYRLIYNSFLDKVRRDQTFNKKIEDLRYNQIIEAIEEDTELKSKRIKILQEAIETLPKKCKEIFILSKYEGLKYQQIADQLGISKNTVEVQVGKAYKILRKSLISKDKLNLFISLIYKKLKIE